MKEIYDFLKARPCYFIATMDGDLLVHSCTKGDRDLFLNVSFLIRYDQTISHYLRMSCRGRDYRVADRHQHSEQYHRDARSRGVASDEGCQGRVDQGDFLFPDQ